MNRLLIKRAVPSDAEAYVRAHVTSQVEVYAPIMPPEYARDRVAEIPALIPVLADELARTEQALAAGEQPFRERWVAEIDGRIVGIACAGEGPNEWESVFDPPPADVPFMLDRLYVIAAAHGSSRRVSPATPARPGSIGRCSGWYAGCPGSEPGHSWCQSTW